MDKLCFPAIQMKARLGDVDHNINAAGRRVKEAFRKGADWVNMPEFFTSAIGFYPKMRAVTLPLEGRAMEISIKANHFYSVVCRRTVLHLLIFYDAFSVI
jgi:predicted amidohydrolase